MILALCGTIEGERLIKKLLENQYKIMATVTTEYGAKCLGAYGHQVQVLEGKLTELQIRELVSSQQIQGIVDVTHPFAMKISAMAMETAKAYGIPYLRYERARVQYNKDSLIQEAADFHEAARLAGTMGERIFLTIGSNHLGVFVNALGVNRLVARVLPFASIIKACEGYGFTPDNIIAMKGPFSEAMNRLMFTEYQAHVVVTKDSGRAGGTEEKLKAAKALHLPVIMVKRPEIDYGKAFDCIEDLIQQLNYSLNKLMD